MASDELTNESTNLQMYTKYRNGEPIAYRYGEPWVATQLFLEGGYKTPEEAIKAWEREQKVGDQRES